MKERLFILFFTATFFALSASSIAMMEEVYLDNDVMFIPPPKKVIVMEEKTPPTSQTKSLPDEENEELEVFVIRNEGWTQSLIRLTNITLHAALNLGKDSLNAGATYGISYIRQKVGFTDVPPLTTPSKDDWVDLGENQ